MTLPYFQSPNATLYQASAQAIPLPDAPYVVVTDPPWPGASVFEVDAEAIFQAFVARATEARRIIVVLGSDTNPAMLSCIGLPFFRVCWLQYAVPHYKGRQLYNGDIAYIFGPPPRSRQGAHVLPAFNVDASSNGKQAGHPAARKVGHMEWLVKWYTEPAEIVVDPFVGSGTTCIAAQRFGRYSIGGDISPEYLALAVRRLSEETLPMRILA